MGHPSYVALSAGGGTWLSMSARARDCSRRIPEYTRKPTFFAINMMFPSAYHTSSLCWNTGVPGSVGVSLAMVSTRHEHADWRVETYQIADNIRNHQLWKTLIQVGSHAQEKRMCTNARLNDDEEVRTEGTCISRSRQTPTRNHPQASIRNSNFLPSSSLCLMAKASSFRFVAECLNTSSALVLLGEAV